MCSPCDRPISRPIQKMRDDPSSLEMQLHPHQLRNQSSGNNLCLGLHEMTDFSHHEMGRDLSSVPRLRSLTERNRLQHHRSRCYHAHTKHLHREFDRKPWRYLNRAASAIAPGSVSEATWSITTRSLASSVVARCQSWRKKDSSVFGAPFRTAATSS